MSTTSTKRMVDDDEDYEVVSDDDDDVIEECNLATYSRELDDNQPSKKDLATQQAI